MRDERLDYDDVVVSLNEGYVGPEVEHVDTVDTSLRLSNTLVSSLPFVVGYVDSGVSEVSVAIEEAALEAAVITVGAAPSRIPFHDDLLLTRREPGCLAAFLLEKLDLFSTDSLEILRNVPRGITRLVGGSVSCRHFETLINESRLADVALVGQLTKETMDATETLGMRLDRVTMLQTLSQRLDVPLLATVASSAEMCKAFVAGADGIVVNVGGPFSTAGDAVFVLKAVVGQLRERLETLCRLSGARRVSDLMYRCRLVTVR